MQVKQRLQINSVVSAVSVLAILAVLFLTIYRVNRALEAAKIADAIITCSFERLILRTDFYRTASERSKAQLIAKHGQIGDLLRTASGKFSDPKDKKIVNELLTNHESIGRISKTIRENREKRGQSARPDRFSQEIEDRLISQLNMRVYETILLDSKLQESSDVAVISSLKLAGCGILFVFLLVSAAILINSWIMGRSIADRVQRLRDGALVIGEGNLEHRIDIKGDDEFAELAGSFNTMTNKLRGSHLELESEIEVRKRAEKEVMRLLSTVQEEKERLSCLVNGISDEVWFADTNRKFTLANPSAIREFSLGSPHDGDVATLAASLEVYRGDGSPRPVEEAPPLRSLTGEIIRGEDEIIRTPGTGELRHRQVSSAPVRNADGKIIGSVSVVRDITVRKLAEETLQEAYGELAKLMEERTRELREKEVLLKEVHHRVKNNLQVISSLVGLQADGSTDETVREVLRDVTYRVRSMALVHEKLYQSADLARIDFAEYIHGLLNYLWRAHGPATAAVRLTLDLEPLSLSVDTAVPCGLILNELAGNALKHAFRGLSEGEVTVSLQSGEDGRIRLSVADNGVGLPTGFDWRETRSLGLRLVQMLAGQLGASVEVGSEEGTRFEIAFGNPG